MTPSNSLALKLVKRPADAASFFLRTVWAGLVLVWVCVLWLLLFVLFLPFLLVSELLGWRAKAENRKGALRARVAEPGALTTDENSNFTFDRRQDVSKLFGCNTRNVRYRWSLFESYLNEIVKGSAAPRALDFGAGSLRDSFELCRLGFQVTAVDLNQLLLQQYYDSYDWREVSTPPQLFTGSFDSLVQQVGVNHFDLAIAFDVIEHLEDPAAYVKNIRMLLRPQGLLFTIVPNGRSCFERHFKSAIRKQREKGLTWTPGVPHLQFKTPDEWEEFFEAEGYAIRQHDMALGFFVNDCWNGWLAVPIRNHVAPVLTMLAYALRVRVNTDNFEKSFSPAWLMERVNVLDEELRHLMSGRFGWNLIVAQPKETKTPALG